MKYVIINAERPKDVSQGFLDPDAKARAFRRGQKNKQSVMEAQAVFSSLMPEAIQTALHFCDGGGKMLPIYTFKELCSLQVKPGLNQNIYNHILIEANFRKQSFAQVFYSDCFDLAYSQGIFAVNQVLDGTRSLRLGGEPTIIVVSHCGLIEMMIEIFKNTDRPEIPQRIFKPGEVGILKLDSGGGFINFEFLPEPV